jgi:aminoglycoside/choline kinase family phosphotransferase
MGIAVYSPEFLDFLRRGPSSVIVAWLRAIAVGKTIGTVDFSGSAWTDIGTPHAYAAAIFDALKGQGKTVYAHASVDCGKAELQGRVVIEQGVTVSVDAIVSNSILLPGAYVSSGSRVEQCIIGRGFHIAIETADIWVTVPLSAPLLKMCGYPEGRVDAVCIGTGGSDRTYYRIPFKNTPYVLMSCTASDRDYERHIVLSKFFRQHGVPVPELLLADNQEKQAIFEDLGDLSLHAWLACRRTPDHIKGMYCKILDVLVMFHTLVTDHAAECKQLRERYFDREHLRWESRYFMENYVCNILQIHVAGQQLLDEDFESLARTVAAFDKVVLHRDFQSQNIMVVHGNEPRIIDFQGARMGPAAYDVVSLLWDPYCCLQDSMRETLLSYYIKRMQEMRADFDEHAFRETVLPCGLQRHMQALGAYGFLSRVKGKKYFLRHVPQAFAYLKQESELSRDAYPALHRLVAAIYEKAAY